MLKRFNKWLLEWKPIHLCWWFEKHNLPIPKYFIGGPATAPSVTTNNESNVTSTSAQGNGDITSDGGNSITERGFCWNTTGSPTTADDSVVEGGTATGVYNDTLTPLNPNTLYYYRAYAINGKGTGYGSDDSFTTSAGIPTITTNNCTGVTSTAATGSGNITNTGGANATRRGFCYMSGVSGDPTTADSVVYDDGSYGTGAYTKALASLTAEGSYRVRAYAVNTAGTGYGSTVQLTLTDDPPTVALNSPNDTATISDTTPDLLFTGTDVGSDEIEYNVQVDTASTFNSQGGVAIDSYSESNQDTDKIIYAVTSGDIHAQGQSFTGDGNDVVSVKFYLKKSGSPTGDAYVSLFAHSGTYGTSSVPTGSTLASATYDISNLTTSYQFIEITFGTPYTTTNGTKYCVDFAVANASTDSSNYVVVGADTSSPSHDGNAYRGELVGGSFAESGTDLCFCVNSSSGTPLLSKDSSVPDATFSGTGDPHPWPSGNQITYTVQAGDALSETTHYWRVRGKDPSGSDTWGAWSSTRSFTVDTGGAPSRPTSRRLLSGVGV